MPNIDKPSMQSLEDLLKTLDEEIERGENIQPHAEVDEEEQVDSLLEDLVGKEEEILSDEE
jgi:hypothetical protein